MGEQTTGEDGTHEDMGIRPGWGTEVGQLTYDLVFLFEERRPGEVTFNQKGGSIQALLTLKTKLLSALYQNVFFFQIIAVVSTILCTW